MKESSIDALADLEAAGLTLRREGGKLMVKPTALITEGHKKAIKWHKADLLTLLAVREAMDVARPFVVADAFPDDYAGKGVEMVEQEVLVWPDGTALAFDVGFTAWWTDFNRVAREARERAGHKGVGKAKK